MGREAYMMRLALGRSALEPPEDSATFTAARAGDHTSALHPVGEANSTIELSPLPPRDVQFYDARGHPFNPWARTRGRGLREAQNDILSVIGVTERKGPVDEAFGTQFDADSHEIDPDENDAGDLLGTAADFEYQILSWWIHAFTNRLLVFPPSRDVSFRELVRLHWRSLGSGNFMFGGIWSFWVGHLVSPELCTGKILYLMERAIMSSVSSKKWRDAYSKVDHLIAGVLEVAMNIFVLPFRLHSMLWILGFQPASTLLQLPPLQSWLPFCGTSLIQANASILPILPFFLFRPLSSLVHQYMFMSLRPAIMGPLDQEHRRRSSSSRYAASVNSAPLLALPVYPTRLTSVFQRVFGFLRWSPPMHTQQEQDLPFNPRLLRRETWSIQDTVTQAPVLADDESRSPVADDPPPETRMQGDNLPDFVTSDIAPSPPISISSPPRLSRVDTVATLDGSPLDDAHHDPNNATIRVASVDPNTGAVNLEIGLPEETTQEYEVIEDDVPNTGALFSVRFPSLNRDYDGDLYVKPHHTSRLALEPTELLASLVNGALAGWVLMPIRVWVLSDLVRKVLDRPEMFGVDPSRAAILPNLLGSSLARGLGLESGFKHIALSCVLDVSIGLCYWLTEYAIVRHIGIHQFKWGKL